jgi:hypothetical protein
MGLCLALISLIFIVGFLTNWQLDLVTALMLGTFFLWFEAYIRDLGRFLFMTLTSFMVLSIFIFLFKAMLYYGFYQEIIMLLYDVMGILFLAVALVLTLYFIFEKE